MTYLRRIHHSSERQWLGFCFHRPLCKHTHFRDSCSVTISCLSYYQGEGISEMKVVEAGVILIYLLKYVLQFVGRWQLKLPRSLFAWRSPLFATVVQNNNLFKELFRFLKEVESPAHYTPSRDIRNFLSKKRLQSSQSEQCTPMQCTIIMASIKSVALYN